MKRPRCPHCNYAFTDDDIWHGTDFPCEYGQEQEEYTCPQCKVLLYITYDPIPNWFFTDEDGYEIYNKVA